MSVVSPSEIPDYSEQAATELRRVANDWSDQAQNVIDHFGQSGPPQVLLAQSEQLANTLQALGYHSIRFGVQEVIELLRYWVKQPPADKNEAALVLLQIADELQSTMTLPASQARRVSALGWLSVIDNCRACRQEPSMSKDVVAAAGIALPVKSTLPMPARSDCEDFLTAIRGVHKSFARHLSQWFRTGQAGDDLAQSANTFIRLADACGRASRLSLLDPLFRSAGVVLQSVVNDPSLTSIAVHRLFGRVERYLATLGRMDFDAMAQRRSVLPDDILRQLLFYVARFPSASSHAEQLRDDFSLQVLATTTRQIDQNRSSGTKLHEQVLKQIGLELDELQTWMGQAAADPGHKTARTLFARLDEQYIAVTLLGFDSLQRAINELRGAIRLMENPPTEASRMAVAEHILRVRQEQEKPNQKPDKEPNASGLAATSVDDVAARLRQLSRQDDRNQFQAMAAVACLRAVQGDLRRAEPEILALLDDAPILGASGDDIAHRFERAAIAVTVIPLPEVVPLINGLAHAVRTHVNSEANDGFRTNLAELLVALDLYLDSVIADSRSLTPLLQRAVESMHALSGEEHNPEGDLTADDEMVSAPSGVRVSSDHVLDVYLATNQQVSPWLHGETNDRSAVLSALTSLESSAANAGLQDLSSLVSRCRSYVGQSTLPADARDLVGETLLVVPQMLHADPDLSENVRGIDELRQRFAQEPAPVRAEVRAPAALRSVPTGKAPEPLQDPLDNTLQEVFSRECAAHIETLRSAIGVARADVPLSKLPSEKMLRALHTLSGCAQTVDAGPIVAIVQPLQKAALGLQREAKDFTADETDFIEKLADAMSARLHGFQHDEPVSDQVIETESLLPEFVATVLSRTQPERDLSTDGQAGKVSDAVIAGSNTTPTNQSGLSAIFRAEADDLMLRLRSHTAVLVSADADADADEIAKARDGSLKVLHTIKGSARMAGNHAMADVAHELESEVTSVQSASIFGDTIRQQLPQLQATITPEQIVPVSVPDVVESDDEVLDEIELDVTRVDGDDDAASLEPPRLQVLRPSDNLKVDSSIAEEALDPLMEAGTMLVSRQAQVDDRLTVLRDQIRDIQASADRLQRLASNNPAFDSVAARELVADIQVARRHLERSVRELQHVHGLAAHAGTSLHRGLIRSRLQTVDSLLPRLQATLSDALTVCEREASLMISGGDVPVSATSLKSLAPLLEQLIRNAVAHGMDSPGVRIAEQKPADGEIALLVKVDGTDLLIEVSDDGDGIDEDELNRARKADGLTPIRNALHLREILCTPGYSTLADATPVAGRGQGLSMVLDGVEALGGELELINEPGEGLTVRLRVPQQMVVAQSLVFGVGNALHAIPVDYVSSVVDYDGKSEVLEHQGQRWAVCTAEQLMGVSEVGVAADRCALLNIGGENLAMPVPELDGYRELIVQSLGAQLQSLERYAGGAVLADGRQVLILNMHRLVQLRLAMRTHQPKSVGEAVPAQPLVALIADDSVTMRVAGERLLQRLGFQVHTARDGLEALDFLHRSLPSVLLLDIEMPGADGFDVVRRIRPKLVAAKVPVIMISTRRGPQERQRAHSLGIQHLIHKPYTETQLREALEEVGVLRSPENVN